MERPRICITLTGKTLKENLDVLDKYRDCVDMAELRADFLTDDERLVVRQFPRLAGIPCILTLRRVVDGGKFKEGEASRTILFARALSFAEADKSKNFEYVDFEEDFHVPSLQDAALAFGTRIIRSVHDMNSPVPNLVQRLESLRTTGFEIPKIAFMPRTLDDVTEMFREASFLTDTNHILIAMGPLGLPTRILSYKLRNYLTFVSPAGEDSGISNLGQVDPVSINSLYHFQSINNETKIFGVTGWPLTLTSSPSLHNSGYKGHGMNAVYIPLKAEKFESALAFADMVGMEGLSVTVPHKEKVLEMVSACDQKVRTIGASNTLVKKGDIWYAHNTDADGFSRALLTFTGLKDLKGKKVAIIGAGGAAKAVAYAVKMLRGKACIFNRTINRAKELAEQYGFDYSGLGGVLLSDSRNDTCKLLKKYSDIIIQTTSVGMNATLPATDKNDPIYFYSFSGKEILFDIVYVPSVTPVMARAAEAGCRVCNGYDMLRFQGYEQFKMFTGTDY